MIDSAAVMSLATQATVWYKKNRVAAMYREETGRQHWVFISDDRPITLPAIARSRRRILGSQGAFGKSRQLCYFVITPVQTRGTSVRRGHSQRGLPAYRNVESLDSCQRLLR